MFIGYVALPLPQTPWWPQLNPLLQQIQQDVRDVTGMWVEWGGWQAGSLQSEWLTPR